MLFSTVTNTMIKYLSIFDHFFFKHQSDVSCPMNFSPHLFMQVASQTSESFPCLFVFQVKCIQFLKNVTNLPF